MKILSVRTLVIVVMLFMAASLSQSCSDSRSQSHELNEKALEYLWSDLDSSRYYASRAFEMAGHDQNERAQALNTMARVCFLKMDYSQARNLYGQVLDGRSSISMQLTANIGLMRICQRTSDNVAFYEYRNRILLLLRTMHDEEDGLSAGDRAKLESLERSFRMESALYYRELEQTALADAELRQVSQDKGLRDDHDRWLMYLYLQGLGVGTGTDARAMTVRTDMLEQCLENAVGYGNLRMQVLASGALSRQIMAHDYDRAIQLARFSLKTASDYSALYEMSQAYAQIARCQTYIGEYSQALENLDKALELISNTVEGDGNADPESLATIHKLMSVAWSGLDNTYQSNLHRDIYLEIQKNIRLDRRYEARRNLLEQSNRKLVYLLSGIGLALLVMALVFLVVIPGTKRSNLRYAGIMQRTIELCRMVLQPAPDGGMDSKMNIVAMELAKLVGAVNIRISSPGTLDVNWGGKVPDRMAGMVLETLTPFLQQAYSSAELAQWQSDSLAQAEKQHYLFLKHKAECKRENLVRRTCCQVVMQCLPWIDRMKAQIERLEGIDRNSREYAAGMEYVRELASLIIRYNDVLAGWISIRRGLVTLNVSSFPLQELFDIVGQSASAFRNGKVELEVQPSTAIVKADRVLTLFMINTLADNARKYSNAGGKVTVRADEQDGYVEISVSDQGIGLSQADVDHINNDKVIDAGSIGDAAPGHGSGFGLMNCKGIIEKYLKSHDMFRVCRFHVESTPGKGSCFSFRLPKGIRRALSVVLLLCNGIHASGQNDLDSLLEKAYDYAYSAYDCNVRGECALAVEQAEMALEMLNRDYLEHGGTGRLLSLWDSLPPAEGEWIEKLYATDYETVLWVRNEVAVSALALKDWQLYEYNDNAYLKLFKQYFNGNQLEQECAGLQHTNSSLSIVLILFVLLLAVLLLALFVTYSRHWIRYRSDLRQLMRIADNVRESLRPAGTGHMDVNEMLQTMCNRIFPDMNSLFGIHGLGLELVDGNQAYRAESGVAGLLPCKQLSLTGGTDGQNVGLMRLYFEKGQQTGSQLLGIVADYIGTALSGMILRFQSGYASLEQLNAESAQMKDEQERLHTGNMVLDNCLSVLKHETVWYPGRIMQLSESGDSLSMLELVNYYRNIFGILSGQALAQTGMQLVQRELLDCRSLLADVRDTVQKSCPGIVVNLPSDTMTIEADDVLTHCLVENLTVRCIQLGCPGPVGISIMETGGFVRFELLFPGLQVNTESLFSPIENADSMAFVLCSRIIREHDESFGHMGCRINAESRQGGTLIWFTLPHASR